MRAGAGFDQLTALPDALAALAAGCAPVVPVSMRIVHAAGRITAAAIRAPVAVPRHKIALRDGWAVAARDTQGASPYTPCFAAEAPRFVACGEALPEGTDAVLAVPGVRAGVFPPEILCAAAPGDYVRAMGGDFSENEVIAGVGERLRPDQVALARLAGIEELGVRVPRVVVLARRDAAQIDPVAGFVAASATREGADCRVETVDNADPERSGAALAGLDADLVFMLGDCGAGGPVAQAIRHAGRVLAHGIAVWPGEPIGCGTLPGAPGRNSVAVVFAPERMENVFSAWLLLARPCLRLIAGAGSPDLGETLPISRKIVSNPGMSELVLLRRSGGGRAPEMWEPLAISDIPWSAIGRADAWLVVPPSSEGYAAGQAVFAQFL